MSFNFRTEEYYKRFIELQEKLRKSEEERLKLEMKFNEMVRVTREEEQMHYRKLRAQYKRFLEEDRRRQDRNERILRTLERIESRVAVLVAKTERFKLLRRQYQTFLDRVYKTNEINKPKVPEISKPKDNERQTRVFDDGNDVVQTYLQNLSSNKLREMLKKEEEARAKLPVTDARDVDDKYNYFEWSNCDTRPNYANSVADDIMDSIYWRENKPRDSAKNQHPIEFNNNLRLTSELATDQFETKPQDHNNITPEVRNYSGMRMTPTMKEPKNIVSEVEDSETDDFSESEEILYKNPNEFSKAGTEASSAVTLDKKKNNIQNTHLDADKEKSIANNIKTKQDNISSNRELINKDDTQLRDEPSSFAASDSRTKNVPFLKTPDVIDDNTILCKSNVLEASGEVEKNVDSTDKVMPKTLGDHYFPPELKSNRTEEVMSEEVMSLKTTNRDKRSDNTNIHKQEHPESLSELPRVELPVQQNFEKSEQPIQHSVKTEQPAIMTDENKKIDVVKENLDVSVLQTDIHHESYDSHNQSAVDQTDQPIQQYEQGQFESHYDETNQSSEHYEEKVKPIQNYDQHGQPVQSFNQQGEALQQYNESGQHIQSFDRQSELVPQYDEYGQPVQSFDQQSEFLQQYDEQGQPLQAFNQQGELIQQYEEQGQFIQNYRENAQYDEHGQFIPQYDEHGQLIQQYDEQVIPQYDENGQLIQQYDSQYDVGQQQYDENGQLIQQYGYEGHSQPQYDENGQLIQHSQPQYDGTGQLIQYSEPQYDENGQLIQPSQPQYDASGQLHSESLYDENGQLIQHSQPQYDESGQIIQHLQPQYDESGQLIQQPYEDQQYYAQQYEENVGATEDQNADGTLPVPQDVSDDKKIEAKENTEDAKKTSNVMEMLDTDSESVKQDTKISHDSDFDFSNG